MKSSRRQRSENRKRRAQRLAEVRNWAPQSRPMLRAEGSIYDMADRARGMSTGGIGLMLQLVRKVGLVDEIDRCVELLKVHLPYHESDHVLNIALNVLAGGHCLEDLQQLRKDEVYLAALGAERIPDPATAGDFCRRFAAEDIETLMTTIYAWVYDKEDNITQRTDENGSVIVDTLDDLGRVTHRDITLGTGVGGIDDEDYEWDGLNRLTLAGNDDSEVVLKWDSLSRVYEESIEWLNAPTVTRTISRTFDETGNVTQLEYPDGSDID